MVAAEPKRLALAYEMAQRLSAAGETIGLLALFDPTWNIPFHLGQMAKSGSVRQPVAYGLDRLTAKADAKLRRARRRFSLVEYRGHLLLNKPVPPAVVFHYNYQMFRRAAAEYTFKPYPGTVTLFHPETGRKRSRDYYSLLLETWNELSGGRTEYHVVPGTSRHLDLFRKPYVEALARQLTVCLAQARQRAESGDTGAAGTM